MKNKTPDECLMHWGYGKDRKWKMTTAKAKGTALTLGNIEKYLDCGKEECKYDPGCYKHLKEAFNDVAGTK